MNDIKTQQVNAQISIILELPISWDEDAIATYLIATIGSAFSDCLGTAPANTSPVNVDFQEEAEIYNNC